MYGRPAPLIGQYRVKGEISWVVFRRKAQDGRMAGLFVRDRESTSDLVDEVDTEDMYDIFTDRVASIGWHNVVETADVPFCFASTVEVEIVVAFGSRPIPLGFQLLTIDPDVALSTRFFGTPDLECSDL